MGLKLTFYEASLIKAVLIISPGKLKNISELGLGHVLYTVPSWGLLKINEKTHFRFSKVVWSFNLPKIKNGQREKWTILNAFNYREYKIFTWKSKYVIQKERDEIFKSSDKLRGQFSSKFTVPFSLSFNFSESSSIFNSAQVRNTFRNMKLFSYEFNFL